MRPELCEQCAVGAERDCEIEPSCVGLRVAYDASSAAERAKQQKRIDAACERYGRTREGWIAFVKAFNVVQRQTERVLLAILDPEPERQICKHPNWRNDACPDCGKESDAP